MFVVGLQIQQLSPGRAAVTGWPLNGRADMGDSGLPSCRNLPLGGEATDESVDVDPSCLQPLGVVIDLEVEYRTHAVALGLAQGIGGGDDVERRE